MYIFHARLYYLLSAPSFCSIHTKFVFQTRLYSDFVVMRTTNSRLSYNIGYKDLSRGSCDERWTPALLQTFSIYTATHLTSASVKLPYIGSSRSTDQSHGQHRIDCIRTFPIGCQSTNGRSLTCVQLVTPTALAVNQSSPKRRHRWRVMFLLRPPIRVHNKDALIILIDHLFLNLRRTHRESYALSTAL